MEIKSTKESRNVLLYYLFQLFYNLEFHAGNWIFFYLIFMNYQQLGVFDTICFTFGMLMEIPTGALADLLGRKLSVAFGTGTAAIGILTLTFGGSFRLMLLGYLLISLGWALYSGASEAFLYDSLKDEGREKDYDAILSKASTIGLWSLLIASLAGAWLFAIHPMLPHLFWGVGYIITFVVSLFFIEPKVVDKKNVSVTEYLNQYLQGFRALWQPKLRTFIPLIVIVEGIPFLFNAGLLRPAISSFQGFGQAAQSFIFAAAMLVSSFIVLLLPLIRKNFSDITGLILVSIILAASFLILGFPIGIFSIIFLVILESMKSLSTPWISTIVNDIVPSKDRATTLSTVAFLMKIPYSVLALISGYIINAGHTSYIAWGMGSVIILLLIVTVIVKYTNISDLSSD